MLILLKLQFTHFYWQPGRAKEGGYHMRYGHALMAERETSVDALGEQLFLK